ncbi:MAG TPA: hypothetical protein VG844_17910 [Terracidiphilus sp.]|jgi:hypothetical protein|nr:hypothetical protein [Terracidiphilus sp.]
MRNALLALLAFVIVIPCSSQAPKDEAYPLTAHVSDSETVFIPGSGIDQPYAEITATIDGHHYKLIGTFGANTKFSFGIKPTTMKPGNYKARLLQDKNVDAAFYFRQYEFLLSDGKKLKFEVIGESEN